MEIIRWHEDYFEIEGNSSYVTEYKLESAIVGFLLKLNILPIKIPNESVYKHFGGYTMRGIPDLLLILNDGRVLFIELKRKGGVLSDYQKFTHEILKERKQSVYVVHSLAEMCDILVKERILIKLEDKKFSQI
jgi:hypothetical protein